MRVVEQVAIDGPAGAVPGWRADPTLPASAPESALIRVQAIGLSFPDVLRSRGSYQDKVPLPYVLAAEYSGVVVEAGPQASVAVGERVAGTTAGVGAAAELVLANSPELVTLPDNVSFEQGAGAVFNYETAMLALDRRGRLESGETLLVHGAGGGTGTAAVQLGVALGAHVIGLVSSEAKAAAARRAGAHDVLFLGPAWLDMVMATTDNRGVDVVFDPVGDRVPDTLRCLAPNGRWVIVGFAGGSIPSISANRVLFRNVSVVGSYLSGYKSLGPEARKSLRDDIAGLIASGSIQPIVGSCFAVDEASAGLAAVEERIAVGKVVLRFPLG
jgi:NADPH2:quinone reductase